MLYSAGTAYLATFMKYCEGTAGQVDQASSMKMGPSLPDYTISMVEFPKELCPKKYSFVLLPLFAKFKALILLLHVSDCRCAAVYYGVGSKRTRFD